MSWKFARIAFLLPGIALSQVAITISAQQSPFPIAKGLALYSVEMCGPIARTVSAAMIRQAAENAGISFQDPALNPDTVRKAASHTRASIALAITKYGALGVSMGSTGVAAFKAQAPGVGNARTWTIIAGSAAGLSGGIPIGQALFQADVNAQATITNGVQAALISDMTALYSVPAGGCSKSVMFFGRGPTMAPLKAVLP